MEHCWRCSAWSIVGVAPHGALLALLRAYLQTSDGKELRLACVQFVYPASFVRGWTELVQLYDLQCAIAELTSADVHYVKRLDPPSWGRFYRLWKCGERLPFADLDSVSALFNCCPECHHACGYEVDPNCKQSRGDCPLPRVHRGAGLNVIGVQEDQHENVLIAVLRGQVDLQHQLLSAQKGRIQQNDVKVAALAARVGLMGGHGASVSQLAVMGPPAVAAPPLILGGTQPQGYAFVCLNEGVVIWGHPNIVQASITDEGDKK